MSTNPRDRVRVAAVGDLHCTRASQGSFQGLFSGIGERADVLVLCGDLTDYGLPEEARTLARELTASALKIPILAVFGNHDYESGSANEVQQILTDESNGYGAKNVKDVKCNNGESPTVKKGDTFDCEVSIDGTKRKVTVTFQDDNGTYEVGRPK